MVRVRFAPSPTGYLHIGGARTALFNWLFARHNNGKFVLRIEDTDRKRSKKIYLDDILDSMNWLGLSWDEGPYFQTKRFKVYKEFAQRLVDEKKAYVGKGGAVIFDIPAQILKIKDLIHGEIEFDTSVLKELVLIKSDGSPTYNFACVIDDATMDITHVIRGDDHISNTPKQIALYKTLGFEIPKFAHVPLIMGEDKARLSKRHGAVAVTNYRKEGFLPEALVNYLALLGWSPGDNREVLKLDELIKEFSLERVGKTQAVFSLDKLNWINSQHMKTYDTDKLVELAVEGLLKKRLIKKDFDTDYIYNIVRLFQSRTKTIPDLISQIEFFFLEKPRYDKEAVKDILKKENVAGYLELLYKKFALLESFDIKSIEDVMRSLAGELNIKAAQIIHPCRVALTGKTVSAGIFEIIAVLGKERTLERLKIGIRLAS